MNSYIAGGLTAIAALLFVGGAFAVFYAGTQQIVSTVAQGTAPITVASTTLVSNLNVDYLDNYDYSALQDGKCVANETTDSTSSLTYVTLKNLTGSGYITSLWEYNDRYDLGHTATVRLRVDGKTAQEFNSADVWGASSVEAQYWLARYNYNFTTEIKSSNVGGVAYGRIYFCRE